MAMDLFQNTHSQRIKEWIDHKKKNKKNLKCQENIKFLDIEVIGFVTAEKVYGSKAPQRLKGDKGS